MLSGQDIAPRGAGRGGLLEAADLLAGPDEVRRTLWEPLPAAGDSGSMDELMDERLQCPSHISLDVLRWLKNTCAWLQGAHLPSARTGAAEGVRRKLVSHSSGGWKGKIGVLADFGSVFFN